MGQTEAAVPAVDSYLLLCCGGLEHVVADALCERLHDPGITVDPVPRQELTNNHSGGEAGVGKLLVTVPHASGSADVRAALRGETEPCIIIGLALIQHQTGTVKPEKEAGLQELGAAVAQSPRWEAALNLLARHLRDQGEAAAAARVAEGTLRFRSSCVRDGPHDWSSNEAMASVGEAVGERFRWGVSMSAFDCDVCTIVLRDCMACGLTLKLLHHKSGNRLPHEPRAYLQRGGRIAMLRPSTAHALLRAARVAAGATLLDPMGGIGTIAVEAALAVAGARCISSDTSAEATACARENAAACAGACVGSVEVHQWDAAALQLPDASVTHVVTDMPFGRQYGSARANKQQVPRLLSEWRRVLKVGGRAVLLSTYGHVIVAAATAVDVAQGEGARWRVEQDLLVNIGGVPASVVVLERL
eukprot:TRINITY_DN25507_c0_g1_i1.p1 TRINITY_DN25507_c0_g1~~TRINITY_DN25507_c0_g1_i1.p1  ORF type:complete len:433 (-),score=138.42 TRINITY_DN25507_c0_g1_i1:127-1377(-)